MAISQMTTRSSAGSLGKWWNLDSGLGCFLTPRGGLAYVRRGLPMVLERVTGAMVRVRASWTDDVCLHGKYGMAGAFRG